MGLLSSSWQSFFNALYLLSQDMPTVQALREELKLSNDLKEVTTGRKRFWAGKHQATITSTGEAVAAAEDLSKAAQKSGRGHCESTASKF